MHSCIVALTSAVGYSMLDTRYVAKIGQLEIFPERPGHNHIDLLYKHNRQLITNFCRQTRQCPTSLSCSR